LSLFGAEVGWIDLALTTIFFLEGAHIIACLGQGGLTAMLTPVKGAVLSGGAHTFTVVADVARLRQTMYVGEVIWFGRIELSEGEFHKRLTIFFLLRICHQGEHKKHHAESELSEI
jgi:hypothetical protein